MDNDVQLKVKNKFVSKYQKGYPLVFKEAIVNTTDLTDEGQVITLVDEQSKFIGKGYYGIQNKGLGWVLSHNEQTLFDAAFFMDKIRTALGFRKIFFNNPETTAFRVFNGEGDGVGGVTIDNFDGYYLFNWYSEGIYQFRDAMIEALSQLVEYKAIYEKKRFASKGKYIEDDDFVMGERGQFPILVKENGMTFAVYLNEGAMVGIFLDQRKVRQLIRDHYADGKTVLNTFSYTGAFSVAAALGGATKTTSVDLANRSYSKTIEQLSLNGIDYEAQDIIVEDIFKYFKYAHRKEITFDMVILDPPSFARSKKNVFSADKDYTRLLKEAIGVTNRDGIIVASTNSAAFGMDKFKGFIDRAFKEAGHKYKLLEQFTLPQDFHTIKQFPEGNYLKVVFIKKQ